MEQKESEYIKLPKDIVEIYSFEEEKPDEKKLVFRIDENKRQIVFFPDYQNFIVNEILLDGFKCLPTEFTDTGYIKSGLLYYFNKKLSEQNVKSFIISNKDKSRIRKVKNGKKLVLNYNNFKILKNTLSEISSDAKLNRSSFVNEFFYSTFPKNYKKVTLSSKKKAVRALRNLQPDIIDELTREDVESFLNFFEILLKTKYKSEIRKRKLFNSTKIKIDKIALENIINDFQKMINKSLPEDKWGKFLKQNLFLIDSKYIHVLPELNLVLANTRKADFGLVDVQGYLDIFEIKKPSTQIMSKRKDRGNYYWSNDAIKAIVQIEKYLYNAEKKSAILEEDIRSQRGHSVKITKPRAFIIIGDSKELDNQDKKNDFRILQRSLKNTEIILFDELLKRIINQKAKVYIN